MLEFICRRLYYVRCPFWLRALVFWLAGGALPVLAGTQMVWLGWDNSSSDANIVEYHVFYGTASGVYTNSDTSYYSDGNYIYGLEEGKTYYFAVSAVDADGHVSSLSAEVVYTVPVPEAVPLRTEFYYDVNGIPYAMAAFGNWSSPVDWQLEYSTDLVNWNPWYGGHGTDCAVYIGFDWGDQFYMRLVLF